MWIGIVVVLWPYEWKVMSSNLGRQNLTFIFIKFGLEWRWKGREPWRQPRGWEVLKSILKAPIKAKGKGFGSVVGSNFLCNCMVMNESFGNEWGWIIGFCILCGLKEYKTCFWSCRAIWLHCSCFKSCLVLVLVTWECVQRQDPAILAQASPSRLSENCRATFLV